MCALSAIPCGERHVVTIGIYMLVVDNSNQTIDNTNKQYFREWSPLAEISNGRYYWTIGPSYNIISIGTQRITPTQQSSLVDFFERLFFSRIKATSRTSRHSPKHRQSPGPHSLADSTLINVLLNALRFGILGELPCC